MRSPRILAALVLGIWMMLVALGRPAHAQTEAEEAKKKQAQSHFERGLQLSTEEVWDAALAEYLLSRQIYPTKAATKNAAICLRKLHRYEEALAMIESLLTDFPNLSDQDRAYAATLKNDVEPFVGKLELRGGPAGASISIDGRDRGTAPIAPLRVSAGTHVVRAYKEGFTPFEARVDVAGKQTAVVELKLAALTKSGRLRVVEQSGKAVDAIVDDVPVGKTPWEGSVSPGNHMVLLRGEGSIGTQPAAAPVRVDETTTLNLAVEPLESELRIESVPVSAAVAIDGVSLGRGVWEGRVRAGAHRVEVTAEGFLPVDRSVKLEPKRRIVLQLALERDESAARAAAPGHVFLDLRGAFALALPGGDLGSGLAVGPLGQLEVGYQLGSGLGFAIDVGYTRMTRSTSGRADGVTPLPVGTIPQEPGTSNDDLRLQGPLAGLAASFHRGTTLAWLARLGAGAWIATVRDTRSGSYTTTRSVHPDGTTGSPTLYDVDGVQESLDATYLYLAPEVRLGWRIGDHLELSAGVEVLVMLALSQPKWQSSSQQLVTGTCKTTPPAPDCVTDGFGVYDASALTSKTVLVFAPGLGVRWEF
jgi:hypothetical protein